MSSLILPTPDNQNILIVQLNEHVDVVSLLLIKLNPDIITIMPFLLYLYIIVWYKFTEFRNLLKSDMQNVSKQDCTIEQELKSHFSFFKSVICFFFHVFVVFITQHFS